MIAVVSQTQHVARTTTQCSYNNDAEPVFCSLSQQVTSTTDRIIHFQLLRVYRTVDVASGVVVVVPSSGLAADTADNTVAEGEEGGEACAAENGANGVNGPVLLSCWD